MRGEAKLKLAVQISTVLMSAIYCSITVHKYIYYVSCDYIFCLFVSVPLRPVGKNFTGLRNSFTSEGVIHDYVIISFQKLKCCRRHGKMA